MEVDLELEPKWLRSTYTYMYVRVCRHTYIYAHSLHSVNLVNSANSLDASRSFTFVNVGGVGGVGGGVAILEARPLAT